MARDTFFKVVPAILQHEGGFSTDRTDPGNWSTGKAGQGKFVGTKYGVTGRTLAGYRGVAVTEQDVRNLTLDEAIEIFRSQYWTPIKGDDLPPGLDYAMLDFAINSGPARAASTLQKLLGVSVDGIIGAKTIDAVRRRGDVSSLIKALCSARLAFMRSLKIWPQNARGWSKRVADVQAKSLRMTVGIDVAAMTEPETLIPAADPRTQKVTATKQGKANVATVVGVMGAGVSEIADKISPYAYLADVLQYLFVGLTLVGAGFALYTTLNRIQSGNDAGVET